MPAARKPGAKNGLVEYLNSQAPRIAVRNTLPLKHYHRSLQLLLAQVQGVGVVREAAAGECWTSPLARASGAAVAPRSPSLSVCVLAPHYGGLQISAYRQVNDEEQLYVMLMRYVRWVLVGWGCACVLRAFAGGTHGCAHMQQQQQQQPWRTGLMLMLRNCPPQRNATQRITAWWLRP
jgi:hypothetical protein